MAKKPARSQSKDRHQSDPMYALRAAHRLWDDCRYPHIAEIKNCNVEINLNSRKINIVKGRKIICIAANLPLTVLKRTIKELESWEV